MVSGTISLPCLGFFSPFPHGTSSLSVSQEYLALRDGPRRFRQDFTCPALLRILLRYNFLRVLGYHHLRPNFPEKFHLKLFSILQSYNLHIAETIRIWAVPLSLATTQGITIVFSSSGYLDVSVLRVRFLITQDFQPSAGRVSPFGNPRIERIFAPPRGLSQLITSFIAFESQGIHHTLLFTFFCYLQLNIQFFPACQRTSLINDKKQAVLYH
jgi:hypothetical protein